MPPASTVPVQVAWQQDVLTTPLGELWAFTDASGLLQAVEWAEHEARLERLFLRRHPRAILLRERATRPSKAAEALARYFDGEIGAIDDVVVAELGTAFQRQVWAGLRRLPRGTTTSYGKLAAEMGRPTACRAVGLANGANPISIVVPCHRVIGANQKLTGYGGGLERKEWLLEHERRHA